MPSKPLPRHVLSLLLPALAVGLILTGCGNGADSGKEGVPYEVGDPLTDSTLALVVSSEYGTDTLLARRYQQEIQMNMRSLSPDQRSGDQMQEAHRKVVRGYARQHALLGEAKAQNIEVDTAQVSARLNKLKQRYKTEKRFQQQLVQNNMTVDSVRSLLAAQLQRQTLQQQLAQDFEQPTSEEVDAYSKENRRIRAQHILIEAEQNAPQSKVDSARQVAEALVDSAKLESVRFADLARRHSEGPSASRGGDLGFFTQDQMVDKFAKAAFALSDSGDVAPEPVRTRFGFHVIRLTNAGEPMDTTQARQQMTKDRRQQALEDQVNTLLEKVTVRANPDVVTAGLYEE